jgi:hypothetical protein
METVFLVYYMDDRNESTLVAAYADRADAEERCRRVPREWALREIQDAYVNWVFRRTTAVQFRKADRWEHRPLSSKGFFEDENISNWVDASIVSTWVFPIQVHPSSEEKFITATSSAAYAAHVGSN